MPFRTISHLFRFNPSSAFRIFYCRLHVVSLALASPQIDTISFELNLLRSGESWPEKKKIESNAIFGLLRMYFRMLYYFEFLFKCRLHLLCVADYKRWMNMKLRTFSQWQWKPQKHFQHHHGRYSISWCIAAASSGASSAIFVERTNQRCVQFIF